MAARTDVEMKEFKEQKVRCSICMDCMPTDDYVVSCRFPMGQHEFHRSCLLQWADMPMNGGVLRCPLCRRNIKVPGPPPIASEVKEWLKVSQWLNGTREGLHRIANAISNDYGEIDNDDQKENAKAQASASRRGLEAARRLAWNLLPKISQLAMQLEYLAKLKYRCRVYPGK